MATSKTTRTKGTSDKAVFEGLLKDAAKEQRWKQRAALYHSALAFANKHLKKSLRDRQYWVLGKLQAQTLYAVALDNLGDSEPALKLLSSSYREIKNTTDIDTIGMVLVEYGRVLMHKGMLNVAITILSEAREVLSANPRHPKLAAVYGNIATIHFMNQHFDDAQQWFRLTTTQYQLCNDVAKQALALRGIGMCLSKKHEYNKAIRYYKDAITMLEGKGLEAANERISVFESLGVDNLNLADTKNKGKQRYYQNALGYFQNCLDIATANNSKVPQGVALRNIAQVFAERDFESYSIEKAITYFEQALEIVADAGVRILESQIMRDLSKAYSEIRETERAFDIFKRHVELQTLLSKEDAATKIKNIEIAMAVEKAEQQLQLEKAANEQYRKELTERATSLASASLTLAQKNAELTHTIEVLENIDTTQATQTQYSIEKLVASLKKSVSKNQHWNEVEQQVQRLHANAIPALLSASYKLTPTERRVCSLILLDLQSKDIANLLFVNTQTVEKYRQRIRKKLGVDEKQNLRAFLEQQ